LLTKAKRRGQGRRHHRVVRDRYQVDVPDAVGEPPGQLGGHRERQPGLADAPHADGGDQPVLGERGGERGTLSLPADERRQPGRQRRGAGRWARRHQAAPDVSRENGQRAPVSHAELAEQRGDVTLHGPHRDEQPGRDLGVRQALGDAGEHLRLAAGYTRRPGCPLLLHDVILTGIQRIGEPDSRAGTATAATALPVSWTSQVSHGSFGQIFCPERVVVSAVRLVTARLGRAAARISPTLGKKSCAVLRLALVEVGSPGGLNGAWS
jgi:hypothetical protein